MCVQIESCLCGHEAQLWEKVLGGNTGERYLCFTKEEKVNFTVVFIEYWLQELVRSVTSSIGNAWAIGYETQQVCFH